MWCSTAAAAELTRVGETWSSGERVTGAALTAGAAAAVAAESSAELHCAE